MRWFELFFLLIVGILFFCLGWEIWKKEKISLIHDYHHKKVKDSDKKAYRQNPTVIDLSKKARPPPGETTLIYMNCLIIWILLTMPMRPSGLFGRAHFVRSKNF